MRMQPLDPRSFANLMLDEGDRLGIELTNLALQKLLYFAHGIFLNESRGKPLVSGYFEAWQHGPVRPAAYKAFKGAGARPITSAPGRWTLLPAKLDRYQARATRALSVLSSRY